MDVYEFRKGMGMVNKHVIIDRLAAQTTAMELGRHVYFSDSTDSASYEEHLDGITVHVPEIQGTGQYEVSADTLAGELDPAFFVTRWLGADRPALIYHHGNTERPFEFKAGSRNTYFHIFGEDRLPDTNVIVLRAPFHKQTSKEYAEKIRSLSNLMAMLCTSVKLIEHLTGCFTDGKQVCVAGISMGGFVVNLHRSFYNTAGVYIPLLAGAALDDLFLASGYRKMTSRQALKKAPAISRILNFEDNFSRIGENNVFPLLAQHDQFIRYERQKLGYGDIPLRVLDKGHITAARAGDELREHIITHLKCCGE